MSGAMSMHHRTIHADSHHFGWNNALVPVQIVAPGETLRFGCQDSSGGQLAYLDEPCAIAELDFSRVSPVSGPIYVDGAAPGDAVRVTLHEFHPCGKGWTAIIPGFGLLADQFTKPELHWWTYDSTLRDPALYGAFARVPLKPFAGTLGLAPAAQGAHSVVPPRRVGGNLDIRDLSVGSSVYLPVEVAGGLFSIGDTHAAQGDGEVCGTAIESAMEVVLTLDLVKDACLPAPRFMVPGPVTRHLDIRGYEVTTGVGPDLMSAARDAVCYMIDLLCNIRQINAADAYMLCSVCADLRISEIVDVPNWVVSLYFPRVVFD